MPVSGLQHTKIQTLSYTNSNQNQLDRAMAQAGSLSAETESLSHLFSLIEAFRAFDADNDGQITAAEVGGIMGSLGYNLSEEDVNLMMEEGDADKDGLLSIGEFLEMNARSVEVGEVMGSYLKIAYEALKADGNDLVSGEELYDVFLNVGLEVSVEDCNAIVASMDGDEDGAVFLEDLKLIVDSLHYNSNSNSTPLIN